MTKVDTVHFLAESEAASVSAMNVLFSRALYFAKYSAVVLTTRWWRL